MPPFSRRTDEKKKRLHFYSFALLKQARLIKYRKSSIKSPEWLIYFKHVWAGEGGWGLKEREGQEPAGELIQFVRSLNLKKLKRGNPF